MAYGYGKTFYTLGNVITEAVFLGFAVKIEAEKCNHKGCGALGPHAICKKCGKATEKGGRDSYWWKKQECSEYHCNGKLGEPQKSKKAKCNMKRYRTLTNKEICHPDQKIELALLEVTLAGRSGSAAFVVDLNNKVFLPGEMRIDWNQKAERYSVRPTDKRSWSKLDINKVENKEIIISKIWETFK